MDSKQAPLDRRTGTISVLRILVLVLGCVLLIAGVWIFLRQLNFVTNPRSDFGLYYASARNLLEGRSIYTNEYYNTPMMTVLVLPFALLPLPAAAVVWSFASLASYLLTGWLILKELNTRLSFPALILLTGFGLCWFPFEEGISLGQVSVILAMLVFVGWALVRNGRTVSGGAVLGLAAAVKLFPGIILVYLLFRKQWKAALSMAISAAAFTLLSFLITGWQDFLVFIRTIILNPSPYTTIPLNLSIKGVTDRLFSGGPWVDPIASSPVLTQGLWIILSLACLVVMVYQLRTFPQTKAGDDRAFAITLFAMMLISPITWPHNYPFLVLALFILLKELMETRNLWLFRLGLIELILISIPNLEIAKVLMLRHAPGRIPWTEGLVFLLPTLAVIVLWLLLAVKLPYAPMKDRTV